MLWSVIKIILFIGIIAALTLFAGYLMETEGGIRLSVAGTEFNLGPLQAVIAAVVLVIAIWIFLKLLSLLVAVLKFLSGDETAISRYFSRSRERKGFEALSDGIVALASGEGRLAMSKAARAERYLGRPELTNLITAQGAELAGDRRKAEDSYKLLLRDDRTRFVGVRGLMKQKLSEGDTDTALKLAEKAFALKPKHEETQDVLLRLQAEHHDWKGARETLNTKLRHGSLPRDVHKRRDAVLALQQAKEVIAEGNTIEARESAIEANRLSPDLVPASAMAARSFIEQDKPKYAARVLKKAWESQPHPDLAAAFAEIKPDETPPQRILRFRELTRINPEHPETRMLLAELNIAAEDFPEARRALGNLVTTQPTARSLALMAAIERGEGADESVIRGWLTRALTASRGPQWVCDNCHAVHSAWVPICENCKSFDTLSWRVPATGEVAMPASTEMLPLIVGQMEKPPVTLTDADEPEPVEVEAPDPDAAPETPPAEQEPEEPAAGDEREDASRPMVLDAEVIEPDEPRKASN